MSQQVVKTDKSSNGTLNTSVKELVLSPISHAALFYRKAKRYVCRSLFFFLKRHCGIGRRHCSTLGKLLKKNNIRELWSKHARHVFPSQIERRSGSESQRE